MCGYGIERMPDLSFRLMSFVFALRDFLFPVGKKLDQFGIAQGFTVVDFGCGPGSYVERASELVGSNGTVYAVDVQPLAIEAVRKKAERKHLRNVVPVLAAGYPVAIDSHPADVIYALDMFHHVKDAPGFLKELHRLLKPGGTLIIESGHQKMEAAREKISRSGFWTISEERCNLFVCLPSAKSLQD
ncbi:MAG: class I SAM-dependent methyltransferase [Proteobacteria bacterium]|nr:class I SAM-dependent methyltransferase [Pseudomonadota bacterium]MBU1739189.1 class I SAM-dependent methyltransferase [Pseudomonadota bacterium]